MRPAVQVVVRPRHVEGGPAAEVVVVLVGDGCRVRRCCARRHVDAVAAVGGDVVIEDTSPCSRERGVDVDSIAAVAIYCTTIHRTLDGVVRNQTYPASSVAVDGTVTYLRVAACIRLVDAVPAPSADLAVLHCGAELVQIKSVTGRCSASHHRAVQEEQRAGTRSADRCAGLIVPIERTADEGHSSYGRQQPVVSCQAACTVAREVDAVPSVVGNGSPTGYDPIGDVVRRPVVCHPSNLAICRRVAVWKVSEASL